MVKKQNNSKKVIPYHIGIIMDGNRRWAKQRGLPTLYGHKKGYDVAKKVGEWCLARGVKILTLYSFSTENWHRSSKEINYLMSLLKKALTRDVEKLHKEGIQLRVIGMREGLPKDLQSAIKKAMEKTKKNTRGILNIALNYGGRSEIVEAVRKIMQKKIKPNKLSESLIYHNLDTAGLPDPDLIIRTSGEQRLSGFLTWQSAYSELLFIEKHWPDFTEKDIDFAISEYSQRNRRFGGN